MTPSPTRRAALALLAPLALVGALPARAQSAAVAKPEDLAVASPLGEQWLGRADAPITMIEYASLTCSHCATFHARTMPVLKAKYIDTGKVRFALREFPFDPLATGGFMLARCAGEGKYYPVTDLLFAQQKAWALSDRPVDALLGLMRQAGFTKDSFEACLRDDKVLQAINFVKDRGMNTLKVDSTPTFFINGRVERGDIDPAKLDALLAPLLPPA